MKRIRNLVAVGMLGSALLAAGAFTRARAEMDQVTGTFTLPFDVRWAAVSLPAGDYSFSLETTDSGAHLVHLYHGREGVALIMSQGHDASFSGQSSLRVLREGNRYAVADLDLPQAGIVLHYSLPKSLERQAAREREVSQNIHVTELGPRGRA